MENEDRQAIEGLFARLDEVERRAGPRDAGADGFIRERIAQQPGAPYFMAQTIVMQDHALQEAGRRIEELERRQADPAPAGDRRFGMPDGGVAGRRPGSVPSAGAGAMAARSMPGGPMPGSPIPPDQGRRGGFLAGAAQTAMGVMGGMMLGNMLGGLFGGGDAKAAEPAPAEEPAEEPASDEGGGFFGGFFGGDDEES